MQLKSENRATNITDYQPIFTPCYYQDVLHIAIRSYSHDGLGYFLLVNPGTLTTSIVLKGEIQHRKTTISPDEVGYFTKDAVLTTPYGIALEHILQSPHPITNDGITHSLCEHEPNEVFLTIDLCPSKKLFEREFFEKLASMDKPVPIAICITEFWITLHQEEFAWLLEQQRVGTLQITWVNHSATHVFYYDLSSDDKLAENFLLDSRTNLTYEFFEVEKSLIMHGQTPSVFFRAPGLVTNKALIEFTNSLGLITLGADAWLAKSEQPQSGSIILVHGNSNEPAGIQQMMTYLEQDEFVFLPLVKAFPVQENALEYAQNLQVKKRKYCVDEETDDDAEQELQEETVSCLNEAGVSWQKTNDTASGKRRMISTQFTDAFQRLTLFRRLKSKDYNIKQYRDETGVNLEVQLPTISFNK